MQRSTYRFGKFSLDPAEHRLDAAGEPVPLTPRVFDLLVILVANAGHLVEKERLLKEVWSDAFVEEANLTRAISVLRRALGETPEERYIETVPKRGYRFVASVLVIGAGAGDGPAVQTARTTYRVVSRRSIALLALAITAVLAVAGGYALLARDARPRNTTAPLHRQLTFTGRDLTPALSPDGTRAAYVSNDPPYRKVMVQTLSGGPPVEVFRAPETGWLRWSPDGSDLLFWARGDGADGLHIVRPPAGARKIGPGGVFVACWSPDGSTIAIATFVKPAITFVDRLGQVQRRIPLQGTLDWIWDLDWSPVNGRLLFVADDEQRRATVWTIRPDGSGQARLLTSPTEILAARWAPGGRSVYYFGRVNKTVSLYKVQVDPDLRPAASAPVTLLSGLETDEGFGLSADGKRLVYARAPFHSNLWLLEVIDSNGRRQLRQTQLTRGTSVIERPHVSPDAASILFSMGHESRANLYTIPSAGGTPRQLTFLDAFSVGGVWSPDGRTIAFGSNEGDTPGVWLVNEDGSSPRLLSAGALSESYELTWSPGPRLLYQQAGNRNYYMLDPRTGRQDPLVADPSVGWVSGATYSPDGSTIAVSWNRAPANGIWTIDARTLSPTLVRASASSFPIGWSRDGTAIIAVDGKRAAARGILVPFELTLTNATILRVPVNGGPAETMASLPFEEVGSVAVFPDGRRFVCTVYSSNSDVWIVEHFDPSADVATTAATRR